MLEIGCRFPGIFDSLSTWSGTGSFCHCHGKLQSNQSCILLWYQSCQEEVRRSWVHVCWFLNKGKEGWCGRHYGFSMWEVDVGGK